MDKAADGKGTIALELALQRANIAVRGARLASWVQHFDAAKKTLSLRDIAEIEKTVLELENAEIPLGNSAAGGDGA